MEQTEFYCIQPFQRISSLLDDRDCLICHTVLDESDSVAIVHSCCHVFHIQCIALWIEQVYRVTLASQWHELKLTTDHMYKRFLFTISICPIPGVTESYRTRMIQRIGTIPLYPIKEDLWYYDLPMDDIQTLCYFEHCKEKYNTYGYTIPILHRENQIASYMEEEENINQEHINQEHINQEIEPIHLEYNNINNPRGALALTYISFFLIYTELGMITLYLQAQSLIISCMFMESLLFLYCSITITHHLGKLHIASVDKKDFILLVFVMYAIYVVCIEWSESFSLARFQYNRGILV
jgi:hypothetical protein